MPTFSDTRLGGTAVAYETPSIRGVVVSREIPKIARRPKRGREPLGAAPTPEAIPAARNEQDRAVAEETSAGGGGGLLSPLTEVSRETQTLKVYDPSDATVWVEVEQITKLVMKDAAEVELEFNFTPP